VMGGGGGGHVARGEVIFSSLPFVHVLAKQARGRLCEYCLLPGGVSISCPSCPNLLYCSPSCRDLDLQHSLECSYPDLFHASDQTRILGRLFLMLSKYGMEQSEELPYNSGPRTFQDLMSHAEKFSHDDPVVTETFSHLKNILPRSVLGDWDYYIQVYGRFMINSFHINSFEVGEYSSGSKLSVGYGLFLGPSILDHSCSPAARVTFHGSKIEVKSKEECSDFRNLKIPYIDTNLPREERKALLRSKYFFDCFCAPCLGEQGLGVKPRLADIVLQNHCLSKALEMGAHGKDRILLTSMKCQGNCGGNPVTMDISCSECGKEVGEDEIDEYRAGEQAVEDLLGSKIMPSGAAPMYMELLTDLFHPCNLTRVKCCQAAMTSCILRDQLEEAVEWGEQLMGAVQRMAEGSEAHRELERRMARIKEELER